MTAPAAARGAPALVPRLALGLSLLSSSAGGQPIDVERPNRLLVGTPGGARTARIDEGSRGRSGELLPVTALRTEWRASLGFAVAQPPLVGADGTTYAVGVRGEVAAVGRNGGERWRVGTGAAEPGPPALLADDSIVFVDTSGEATAVRGGKIRWRLRFGRGDSERPAPLPLADGGVVVATAHEVSALDAEGNERARTTLLEPIVGPLIAALGRVAIVTASGAVWTWVPGAQEATRVGGFGTPIADGAALADDRVLLAVGAGHSRLLALDLARGSTSTRAVESLFPAALWVGPLATRGPNAYLLAVTATSDLLVTIDGRGTESGRTMLAAHPAALSPDAGVAAPILPPHTPMIVDRDGTVAFATPSGGVGVATGGGVEILASACPAAGIGGGGHAPAVAGIAPLGPRAIVALCSAGALVTVRGSPHPSASDPARQGGEPPAGRL